MSLTSPSTDDVAVGCRRRRERGSAPAAACAAAPTPSSRADDVGVDEHVGRADEAGDERRRRPLVDLVGRADLLDAAVVEHRDAVAHRQRLALVVGDEDERDADVALDRLQLDLHLLAELEVERAERLVEQQHLGPVDERPGERDALALAAGQLVRPAAAEARRGARRRASRRARRRRSARPTPLTFSPYSTLLLHRHVREQRVVLEHGVDIAVVRRRVR